MRKIKVTEKNIRSIAAQLKRFFNNSNYGYRYFHNYDCGFKNIKPYSDVGIESSVDGIRVSTLMNGESYIEVNYQTDVSREVIRLGSMIVFKGGNEIILQQKWVCPDHFQYSYIVFRLQKLTDQEYEEIARERDFEKSMNDLFL
ncbi:hypothetical protein JOD82_002183 [Paenibacillus sp. 1182]|uniref:hypothetical protein n=1 Tax=Paenibacillus sp. 1182 TaxID=2806565 RepID=UPI001AE11726|nr:hypothetical protein [Paenibacillus sp. 1182]MBP1309163.1 hypothetical protein [Paenibacillus sp. 1182]